MEGDLYNPFRRSQPSAVQGGEAAALVDGVSLDRLRFERNMAALAAAALDGRSTITPSPPILDRIGLSSRPARLSDVASGWFAYWMRELNLPVRAGRENWRKAAALQALFEAGLLRAGARLGLEAGGERILGDYLCSLCVIIRPFEDEHLDGQLAFGVMLPVAPTVARQARMIWIGDISFAGKDAPDAPDQQTLQTYAASFREAGWAVGDLDFDLGDHPMDGYVALSPDEAEGLGGVAAPRLRVASASALTTPYILIADRQA